MSEKGKIVERGKVPEPRRVEIATDLAIFHLREKSVPCDQIEVKDKIEQFAWEPFGKRVWQHYLAFVQCSPRVVRHSVWRGAQDNGAVL